MGVFLLDRWLRAVVPRRQLYTCKLERYARCMTSRYPSQPTLLAPGVSSNTVYAPGRFDRMPAVDDRIAAPESRVEIIDNEVFHTMGSNQPHGVQHFDAVGLFSGVLADGYSGAIDMLTRTDEETDIAPDICVFPSAPDPATGGRQLEEIAFEILDTERLSHATRKVEKYATRGVRRIFALRVTTRMVYEWNHEHGDWMELGVDVLLHDRCFLAPFPPGAFLDRVAARDSLARSLFAHPNRVVTETLGRTHDEGVKLGRDEGVKLGRDEGMLAALIAVCETRLARTLDHEERANFAAHRTARDVGYVTNTVATMEPAALAAWLRTRP
jgi:hypothetical protein